MTFDELKKLEPLWDVWYIEECIGHGSFGDVYRIKREEYGNTYYAALKTISFPNSKSEADEILMTSGGSIPTAQKKYKDMLNGILGEIQILEKFKGNSTIVSYEDHKIIEHNEGEEVGYDIFIRMELLNDLQSYFVSHQEMLRDENEIRKIGIDMCEALSLCHEQNIIHRDIKPANIFVSNTGRYKLGDFGVAKDVTDGLIALSYKGTYTFMAPEVFNRQKYDKRADIYSLGMMLYYILNDFHGPFADNKTTNGTVHLSDDALAKRMSGKIILPQPVNASTEMAAIIAKACAYNPNDRFGNMMEFKDALLGKPMVDPTPAPEPPVYPTPTPEPQVDPAPTLEPKDISGKKKGMLIPAIIGVAICLVVVIGLGIGLSKKKKLMGVAKDTINNATDIQQTVDESRIAKVDKLGITCTMPEGWTVGSDEDKAWAVFEEGDSVYKEISVKMDYWYAADSNYMSNTTLDEMKEPLVEDGAVEEYALAMLQSTLIYSAEDHTVEESAVYRINDRDYYYVQFRKNQTSLAFYYTVQDGVEIYFRLYEKNNDDNGGISEADRETFDKVVISAVFEPGIEYANLRAKDYLENVFALNSEKEKNKSLGISISLPLAGTVKSDESGMTITFSDNSYAGKGDFWYADYAEILIRKEKVDTALENGMNDETMQYLEEREQKSKNRSIFNVDTNGYRFINGRNWYYLSSKDDSGKYLSYMTMYKGELLRVTLHLTYFFVNTGVPDELKNMLDEIVNSIDF